VCQFLCRLLYVVRGQSCQDTLCILLWHVGEVTVDLSSKGRGDGDATVLQGHGEVQCFEFGAVHALSIGGQRCLWRFGGRSLRRPCLGPTPTW